MAEVIVNTTTRWTAPSVPAHDGPAFTSTPSKWNRLETPPNVLLRDARRMFDEASDPIEVIKWKGVYRDDG